MTVEDRSPPNSFGVLAALSGAALAFSLAQTTLFPVVPALMVALHTDQNGVTWALTAYFVSAAVSTPVVGRCGDLFGKRRMLLVVLAIFTVGGIVSAVSAQLWLVVVGRAVQGLGGGVFPLCFSLVKELVPPRLAGRGVGLISALAGIGGGVGLVLGGVVADRASYHWVFWIAAVMGAAAAVLCWWLVPEGRYSGRDRLDIRGAVVLAVGLTAPLIAISMSSSTGWLAPRFLVLVGVGIVVLAGWVVLQRRTRQPLVDMSTLRRPAVLLTNVVTVLVGFGMFGSFLLVPTLAEAPLSSGYGFGMTATAAGVLLLPGSIAMLVLGPVAGWLGGRVGNKYPLAIGGVITGAGLAGLAAFHGTPTAVMLLAVVVSGGIALAFAAMPNLILASVPDDQAGAATGFNALVRAVGSSVGSQVCAAILAASVVGTLPDSSGFTMAFAACAVACVIAGLLGFIIPTSAAAPVLQRCPPPTVRPEAIPG